MIGWILALGATVGVAERVLRAVDLNFGPAEVEALERELRRHNGELIPRAIELSEQFKHVRLVSDGVDESGRGFPHAWVLEYEWQTGQVVLSYVGMPQSIGRARGPSSIYVATMTRPRATNLGRALRRAQPAIARLRELRGTGKTPNAYNALEVAKAILRAAPNPEAPAEFAIPIPISYETFGVNYADRFALYFDNTNRGVRGSLLPFIKTTISYEDHLGPYTLQPWKPNALTLHLNRHQQLFRPGIAWREVARVVTSRVVQHALIRLVEQVEPTTPTLEGEMLAPQMEELYTIFDELRSIVELPVVDPQTLFDMLEAQSPQLPLPPVIYAPGGRAVALRLPRWTDADSIMEQDRLGEFYFDAGMIAADGVLAMLEDVEQARRQAVDQDTFTPEFYLDLLEQAQDVWTYAFAADRLEREAYPYPVGDEPRQLSGDGRMQGRRGQPPAGALAHDNLRYVVAGDGGVSLVLRADRGPITAEDHHAVPNGMQLEVRDGSWTLTTTTGEGILSPDLGPSQFVTEEMIERVLSEPSTNAGYPISR